jgi:hypothetical protein
MRHDPESIRTEAGTMKKITAYTIMLTMMALVVLGGVRDAVAVRLQRLDNDRGDVPGWAIASGAACVLGALVYAAYNGVINKWIKKIQ